MTAARGAAAAALLALAIPAWAHPRFPRVYVGGVFHAYGPPYPVYPYPYPYPYPPPPPPPPWPEPDEPADETEPRELDRASYGLVQLRGVPDGADVDLDGRFWLVAEALDRRWLGLPEGEHTLTVRAPGRSVDERRIVIAAGKTHVVRFPIAPR
jgi:hypothetical protein